MACTISMENATQNVTMQQATNDFIANLQNCTFVRSNVNTFKWPGLWMENALLYIGFIMNYCLNNKNVKTGKILEFWKIVIILHVIAYL